jgi:hypothetical protein
MEDLKDTLDENAAFYREQERKITARLALLPKGRIRSKTIGGAAYFYLQYRKGQSVKSDYIGRAVPADLRDRLAERDRLEKELLAVREALRLLRSRRKEEVDLTEPILAILRAMTQHQLWESGFEIIGSWCFLLYQKHLPMERYPLKTEDLDILVPRPFKGRAFDLPGMMQRLGFSQHFNADGSMYFTGNRIKVEFVTKERRDGTRPPRPVKEIALTPQELRHLDILLADPIVLRLSQGIRAKVPSPSAFLLHKLFLAARSERRDKSEKDIKQAVYTGQYALADTPETARLLALWEGLPRKWKSLIRKSLARAKDMMPLEQGVIERLMDLLR